MMTPRPKTLQELADRVASGSPARYEMAGFIAEFRQSPNVEALAATPELLERGLKRGAYYDVFLAASAETFSRQLAIPTPAWAFHASRSLDQSEFDFVSREGRLFLLKDSSAAFKSRNRFVTAAILERA